MITDEQQTTAPGPYAAAAEAYRRAGWTGILPLPPGAKWPPPDGWTGRDGATPSGADIWAWCEGVTIRYRGKAGPGTYDSAAGNIALRLPHHIVGIDVDDYSGKGGGATLAALEAAHGELPPTWRVTARDDGVSGIRLYRIPPHLHWPNGLGAGIEIVRHSHRYAVCWPSIHPDTGGTYRWINGDGLDVIGAVPDVETLPDLPAAWVDAITGGRPEQDVRRAGLDSPAVAAWLTARGAGTPCRAMLAALERAGADLADRNASRHDVALAASARLAHLASEGHAGGQAAMTALQLAFLGSTTGERRDPGEWERMVAGAVDIAAATPGATADGDPCANPFAGLLEHAPAVLPARLDTTRGQDRWQGDVPTTADAGPTTGQATAAPVTDAGHAQATSQDAPAISHGTASTATADAPGRERTSWWPRDLAPVLSGEQTEPSPTFLRRTDGAALFYPGKVNGLLAESETGKTWVALHAITQALGDGHHVMMLDFEDAAPGIIGRLRALGADEGMLSRFHYADPDVAFDALAQADLLEALQLTSPALVILDGVNTAMSLLGYKMNDNDDATAFSKRFLIPITKTGAAVVAIDHLPKNAGRDDAPAAGAIGAQAKRAMMTGCALRVERMGSQIAPGQVGKLRLIVDKDRPGLVRAISRGAKTAGTFVLDSTDGTGATRAWLEAPAGLDGDGPAVFRPTTLMQRVSDYLETVEDGASVRAILSDVSGKAETLRTALDVLVSEGHVTRESRGQSVLHRLIKPYSIMLDSLVDPLTGEPCPNRVPVSQPCPDRVPDTVASVPPQPCPRVPLPVGGDTVHEWDTGPHNDLESAPTVSPIIDWSRTRVEGDVWLDVITGEIVGPPEGGR